MPLLPDAPWIRDAEMNGMPDTVEVKCPVCGEECETIYMIDREPFCCDRCFTERLEEMDAYEWFCRMREVESDV